MSHFNISSALSSSVMKRLVLPAASAVMFIAAAELIVESKFRPTFWEKTSWLLHDPYRGEGFDRLVVKEKLSRLLKYNPDVISVGDSSGFFTLQSTIINRYLPGNRYVNLSTGANQAFDGYKAIAEFALKQTPSIKHVVLHMYPPLIPSPPVLHQGGLSSLLQDNLISFRSWVTPPSAALSPYVKTFLFDGRQFDRHEPLSNHKVTLEFRSTAELTLGWAPEHDVRFDRFRDGRPFSPDKRDDWLAKLPGSEQSSINYVLADFERMVESYGAKLVIAFAPMSQRSLIANDPARRRAEQEVERFQREHPDVTFLFPFVTQFGSEKFGRLNHIAREYTFISSKRFGVALGDYLKNPQTVPKFVARDVQPSDSGKPSAKAAGDASAELREAALAFFLYTATADPSYRSRISQRVIDHLDKDKAFAFMMDDAKMKIGYMTGLKQKLGYSVDQMIGTPVAVENIPHCNDSDPTLRWVQLSGTLKYTYEDPERQSAEPVAWPANSNILVPTVMENGVRKFDGYCPEPSMAALSQD
jgi:hypothetical protein